MKSETNVAFLKMQSPPSIPSHNNVFGYEEATHGMLIKQSNPDIVFTGEKGDTIGPGHYQIGSSFEAKNKIKGMNWKKCQSKRELNMELTNSTVGPGQYNIDKINIFSGYKFRNSSIFSSKVPRMMNSKGSLKSLHNKRASLSAPKTKTAIEQAEETSDEEGAPGPGYYNSQSQSDFNQEPYTGKMQYFGSTVERFPAKKMQNLGPGNYNVETDFSVAKKRAEINNKNRAIGFDERFKEMKMSEVPGPGAYKEPTLVEEISKKTRGKKGAFGATSNRFQHRNSMENLNGAPGPGAYKPEKSVALLDNKKNASIKRASSMFLSTTIREPNKVKVLKNPSPPPGSYNLETISIAENIRRRIDSGLGNPMLARLKTKIKLVAPFNSLTDRFKTKTIKEDEKMLGPSTYNFKSFVETSKKKSNIYPFASSEGRFTKEFEGNPEKRFMPGPGNYDREKEDPWNKRTFNITYAD